MSLPQAIDQISRETHAGATKAHKKQWGQFFTPDSVAQFMAGLPRERTGRVRVLDPGAGTGMLGLTMADRLLASGSSTVELVMVEAEPTALRGLRLAVAHAMEVHGDRLDVRIVEGDFLRTLQPTLEGPSLDEEFDIVVSNPPYFKMSPSKPVGGDAPNAYARFMEVGRAFLRSGGDLVFIVPRSFASGFYFKKFRRRFHRGMRLQRVHVFESRSRAFKRDSVLQENVIVHYRREDQNGQNVVVSHSPCPDSLDEASALLVPWRVALADPQGSCVLNLPTSQADLDVLARVNSWRHSLRKLGLRISTGPVVPFRTDAMLNGEDDGSGVPLLWLQHVVVGQVSWPIEGFRKPQRIREDAGDKLLVPNSTYVLLRRFSAKEDARRLTAGVYEAGQARGEVIGLENHLNYIHADGDGLGIDLAHGLAAIFSLPLVDRYFAISNGNTQVSATEIRKLPLPPREHIEALGKVARRMGLNGCFEDQEFQEEALGLLP